jgi:hypothetical protein
MNKLVTISQQLATQKAWFDSCSHREPGYSPANIAMEGDGI